MSSGSFLSRIDWLLLVPTAYLLVIGLVLQQSLSDGGNSAVNLTTQLGGVFLGLILGFVLMRSPLQAISRVTPVVYFAAIVALVLVLVAGVTVQGAQRWINIGSWQFQPSELAKIGLILITARLLASRKELINKPMQFLVVSAYLAMPVGLILLQPDLGTAIVLVLLWMSILAVSRLKTRVIGFILVAFTALAAISMPLLATYQQDRIISFINPSSDPLGSGYNVLQSTIAVGSGGLLGKGLDAGTQSQFNFLPSAHTDFVFAVSAEKLGIIGGLSILIAFLIIIIRSIMIAWSSNNEFGRYLVMGVAVLFLIQTIVNIGMNLGLMPVTGLPLPLMSYGGTHMAVELALLGLVAGVSRKS